MVLCCRSKDLGLTRSIRKNELHHTQIGQTGLEYYDCLNCAGAALFTIEFSRLLDNTEDLNRRKMPSALFKNLSAYEKIDLKNPFCI